MISFWGSSVKVNELDDGIVNTFKLQSWYYPIYPTHPLG